MNIIEHRSCQFTSASVPSEVDEGTLINIAVMIQDQMRRHKRLVEKIASPRQRKEITAFIQVSLLTASQR